MKQFRDKRKLSGFRVDCVRQPRGACVSGPLSLPSSWSIPQVTTANKFDPYGGADPRELPAYGISEAAHYLSIPDNTIRSWVCGRSFPAKDGVHRSQRVIEPADPRTLLLSFVNLLELHVLGAIRRE